MTRPPFESASPWSSAPTPSASPSAGAVSPIRWQAILDDLAARGVTTAPALVSARTVTWPNGALGCPEPGVMYTQALVTGQQVVVSADGREYDYRFGRTDRARLCER